MSNQVFTREFPDGFVEIGVLEFWSAGFHVMDVGDFCYVMEWNSFEYPFIWIGEL